jgi:putative ABC transport system permease protein
MRTRLGLGARLLIHNKVRLAVASASVAVGVIIIFVELGFLLGILDAQSLIATLARGDLLVMNITRVDLHRWDNLYPVRLDQVAAQPGVARVTPVYEDHVGLEDRSDKRVRRIILYAFPPNDIPLAIGDPEEISRRLKVSHGFLYDRLSRPIFGSFKPGDEIKIDKFPLLVGGYVRMGADIVNDGNIVISEGDWLDRFPDAKPIMGVVHLKPGADLETVRRAILLHLPPDVVVLTPWETKLREYESTLRVAPVGILFLVGMLAGLVIGTINCYQVLYNEISDRLPQFATLKAMGFSNGFLRRVILEQAIVLSLSGFVIGLVLSLLADGYIASQTALPIRITALTGLFVGFLTVAMCAMAGLIAIRRVALADPAELY